LTLQLEPRAIPGKAVVAVVAVKPRRPAVVAVVADAVAAAEPRDPAGKVEDRASPFSSISRRLRSTHARSLRVLAVRAAKAPMVSWVKLEGSAETGYRRAVKAVAVAKAAKPAGEVAAQEATPSLLAMRARFRRR
jgi:hypothetical protein